MATKQEMAEEAKVQQLRQLAADNEVDLEGATKKDDIAAKIVASRKVTKEDLEAVTGDSGTGDGTDGGTPDTAVGRDAGGEPALSPAAGAGLRDNEDTVERVEGRTSDAASRSAEVRAA